MQLGIVKQSPTWLQRIHELALKKTTEEDTLRWKLEIKTYSDIEIEYERSGNHFIVKKFAYSSIYPQSKECFFYYNLSFQVMLIINNEPGHSL